VVNLITNAAAIGSGGTNNGGGVITFISNQAISITNEAYVAVQVGPPSAIQAGGGWRLKSKSSYWNGPDQVEIVTNSNDTIEFNANLPGWIPPGSRSAQLTPGLPTPTVISNAFYTVTNPVLFVNRGQGVGMTGTTGTTYRLEYSTSLLTGAWQPLKTNVLTNGFNLLLPWPLTNGPASFYRAMWLTN
jgi:hypothetical protein